MAVTTYAEHLAWVERSMVLTARQWEVLQRLANGQGRREAALAMGITVSTLKEHLTVAQARLGAVNTAHTMFLAMRKGLIQ
jgi:DNA-binding CsgD family transcriptional regulator